MTARIGMQALPEDAQGDAIAVPAHKLLRAQASIATVLALAAGVAK